MIHRAREESVPASGKGQLQPLRELLLPLFSRYGIRLLLGFASLAGVDLLQLLIPRFLKTAVDSLAACLRVLLDRAERRGLEA